MTTRQAIRKMMMEIEGVRKVKITRDLEVHVYGDMSRGDGGRTPWWQYKGDVKDITKML